MNCNALMMNALKNASWDSLSLNKELKSFIEQGFEEKNGCIFLSALIKNSPSDENIFDRTGTECFVNSLHIDDFVSERYLDYACLFCNNIIEKWRQEVPGHNLNVIVISDDLGAVVKIHTIRPSEKWLNSDLDKYGEAIFETNTKLNNI